jgi:hypothetical protein
VEDIKHAKGIKNNLIALRGNEEGLTLWHDTLSKSNFATQLHNNTDILIVLLSPEYFADGHNHYLEDLIKYQKCEKALVSVTVIKGLQWQKPSIYEENSLLHPNNDGELTKFDYMGIASVVIKVEKSIDSIQNKPKIPYSKFIKKGIVHLNYKDQKEKVDKFRNNTSRLDFFKPVNIFIVGGHESCVHEILVDYVLSLFNSKQDKSTLIKLNARWFKDFYEESSDAWLWEMIAERIITDKSKQKKQFIIETALDSLKEHPFVILIDNIQKTVKENINLINKLWEHFNTGLEDKLSDERHPIIIFLLDREGQYDYSKEQFWCHNWENSKHPICVLQDIKPLSIADLNNWISIPELRKDCFALVHGLSCNPIIEENENISMVDFLHRLIARYKEEDDEIETILDVLQL